MLRILSRSCLGVLMALQSTQPALCWNWVVVEESCCCEVAWDYCGDVVIDGAAVEWESYECSDTVFAVDDWCCEGEQLITDEPVAVESDMPQPQPADTPQPELNEEDTLPPAPIAVPPAAPATAPADSPASDLFPGPAPNVNVPLEDGPAAAPQTEPQPSNILPPVEQPAPQPRTDTSDLFQSPSPQPEADFPQGPAPGSETPAPQGESTGPGALDDIFGEPVVPPNGAADEAPPANEVPAAEDPATDEAPTTDPLDDLFGLSFSQGNSSIHPEFGRLLQAAGGFASDQPRNWSDRTDTFRCSGRLVRVTTDGVFIIQPDGELQGIGFSKLSDSDLAFVRDQVRAERALRLPTDPGGYLATHEMH